MNSDYPARGDFLARLADRALGRAKGVAPRVPFLFEPVTDVAATVDAEADGTSGGPGDGESPAPPPAAPTPVSAAHIQGAVPPSGPAVRESPAPNVAISLMRVGDTNNLQPDAGDRGQTALRPVMPAAVPQMMRAAGDASPREAALPVDTRRDMPAARPLRETPIEARPPTPALLPAPTSPPPSGVLVARHVSNERPAATRPTREAPSADRPPAQPEPTIHVTIGRLEVRASEQGAARPAAPADRHRRRPMTVEEYLQQRGGGR